MDKFRIILHFLFLLLLTNHACEKNEINKGQQLNQPVTADSGLAVLNFSLDINKTIYQKTNFGDPPQLAIWIKDPESKITRTVWVSHRAGKNDWKGKVECPVALPFWQAQTVISKRHSDDQRKKIVSIDAPSGATPVAGRFSADIKVPRESEWEYYIEVNVSADYNHSFPYWSKEGLPDSEANGQPSLVYAGRIKADGISSNIPELIGRTQQRRAVDSLSAELEGITSAKRLIENIEVRSSSQ